jgi:hypothetical protein
MKSIYLFLCVGLLLIIPGPVFACDICAIASSATTLQQTQSGFYLGLSEQFTRYGTLQFDNEKTSNPLNQFMNSSVTQMFLGYNINSRVGIQLTVPFIHRSFRRPEEGMIQNGSVTGFGDSSLIARVLAFRKFDPNFDIFWNFLGGLKMPSGNPSLLAEELNENEEELITPFSSAIHGHDLALGSGSWDGVIGSDIALRWYRMRFAAALQYSLRTRGTFGYRFANDLIWSSSLGGYLFLRHNFTIVGSARASGDRKSLDNLNGVPADDTGINEVFMGPEILATWKGNLSVIANGDIPVILHNTSLQAVPSYRMRLTVSWKF